MCLHRALPSSLLLLSRAWLATQPIEAAAAEGARNPHLERLKETLSSLPDEVIEDVGLEACSDRYTTDVHRMKYCMECNIASLLLCVRVLSWLNENRRTKEQRTKNKRRSLCISPSLSIDR